MEKVKCPACGELYDGRACRCCGYRPFQEDGKGAKWAFLAGIAVVLAAVCWALFPTVAAFFAPEAQTSGNGIDGNFTVLFEGGGVTVAAQWQDGQLFGDGVPITLVNESQEKVSIAFKEIVANGYVMETSLFQLSAEAGESAEAVFAIHETDLENTDMEAVTEVSFNLTAFAAPSYTSIAKTDRITLKGAIPAGFVQNVESGGTVLYEDGGVKVVLRSYKADEDDMEDVTKGKFLFYIQNDTDRHLRVAMPEVLVNGEKLDIGIWSELLPGTKAVTGMYLYRLKDLGIQTPQQVQTLSYNLEITDRDDEGFRVTTETATVNMWE